MSKILVIPDLHLPAVRKKSLQFCKDIYKKWNCNKVVFIGDLVDWHSISHYVKNPNLPGPKDEYELAKKLVQEWYKAFPVAQVCIGNHDERPSRLAETVNIPDFMLKPYGELWNTPGWKWEFSFEIDDVHYRHGTDCSGIHPAWNLMNKIKCSSVIGHCHSRAGIKWSVNKFRRFFAMDVGSLIDDTQYQFAYGKNVIERSVCSCGVVIDAIPYLEVMAISKGEKYYSEWKGKDNEQHR
jgi:hypothetical protein